MISAVFDGNNKILYVDGQVDSVKENPHRGSAIGTGQIRYGFIGDGSEAGTFDGKRNRKYYDGLIDEVRLYSRALSAEEIKEAFNQDSN